MQTVQGTTMESLRAVQAFLQTNADKLAGVVKTGARQQLDDAIAELSGHVADQRGSDLAAQGATQRKHALRLALLRDHMAPVARIARADLPPTPELEPLKMPKGNPTAERLAALAVGMANAAAPFTDLFVSAGLQPDFIAQLNAAASALVATLGERTQSRGKRGGATAGLKQKLSRARKIVHILDAFVKSALTDDPSLLANWNLVKRVRRTARGKASASQGTSPTQGATDSAAVPSTTSGTGDTRASTTEAPAEPLPPTASSGPYPGA